MTYRPVSTHASCSTHSPPLRTACSRRRVWHIDQSVRTLRARRTLHVLDALFTCSTHRLVTCSTHPLVTCSTHVHCSCSTHSLRARRTLHRARRTRSSRARSRTTRARRTLHVSTRAPRARRTLFVLDASCSTRTLHRTCSTRAHSSSCSTHSSGARRTRHRRALHVLDARALLVLDRRTLFVLDALFNPGTHMHRYIEHNEARSTHT